MFDNVLYQNSTNLLSLDIQNDSLPPAVLLSGPQGSGKLTCALEISRILSCSQNPKAAWVCTCNNCLKNKSLIFPNLMIIGSGNRSLEIGASKRAFLQQVLNNTSHVEATRYLFLRSVRKLTLRFSPILWQNDNNYSKISTILGQIDENLELVDIGKTLPEDDELTKLLDEIEKLCLKLEKDYLYESIPVSQVRAVSSWAHLTSEYGKKVIIIENCEKMAESSRNALLKILEEVPENVQFILTSSNRGAIMPTILSRLRTYTFNQRSIPQEQYVLKRVFHLSEGINGFPQSINGYLQEFLPIKPDIIKQNAYLFFENLANGKVSDISTIYENCKKFEVKSMFKIFMEGIIESQKKLLNSSQGTVVSSQITKELQRVYNNVITYNQNPQAALEELNRSLMQINYMNRGVFKEAL